jgi:two-component system response regulator HydG
MTKHNIIVVEDNETMRLGIKETLRREEHQVFEFDNGIDAINFCDDKIHIAIIDLKMDPINGIETLEKLKQKNPSLKALMISAYGSIDEAVKAMQLGASDFLSKPFSPDELRIRLNNIIREINTQRQIELLAERNELLENEISSGFEEFVGESDNIKKVYDSIEALSKTDSTVLIYGESGTGKELVARAIHRKSDRVNKPFIKLNCGVLNDNLLESELFGHERGSFTGAIKQKKGRFELASSGTLFLDEIGELSQNMQVKLLRVLQENEFERVGGERTLQTDARIIAATNKNLQKLVKANSFREDLYYRLNVIPVKMPPLRDRAEDIVLLTKHFLNKTAQKNKTYAKSIDANGLKILMNYNWPGNIRELENLMERLSVISRSEEIDAMLIAQHLNSGHVSNANNSSLSLDDTLYTYEKNLIMDALKKTNGVKNQAAKLLGIKTSALYYKLEKFGLL